MFSGTQENDFAVSVMSVTTADIGMVTGNVAGTPDNFFPESVSVAAAGFLGLHCCHQPHYCYYFLGKRVRPHVTHPHAPIPNSSFVLVLSFWLYLCFQRQKLFYAPYCIV
jgi:hypothetical protein